MGVFYAPPGCGSVKGMQYVNSSDVLWWTDFHSIADADTLKILQIVSLSMAIIDINTPGIKLSPGHQLDATFMPWSRMIDGYYECFAHSPNYPELENHSSGRQFSCVI